ncbi:hypothetical protein DPMN_109470 [Dreissena polymorpha]|uniref:Uncharacterized protein n=1 Tax=Dreissena polymorpha TaxID=45954 RepID=A0A9D4QM00_DREPO|nr:hypothetical protein DPMN_109470 [Dreissena polymorpha]
MDGPGTLIGHCENDCWVWVEWDKNQFRTYTYRYGQGFYDVLVVDDVRQLKSGELMAVGCHVKPGRDGKFRNVHAWNKGVVIKMKPPKARVRWDSGIRGEYSYGQDGKLEIEICSPESTTYVSSAHGVSVSGHKHINKNKASKNK